MIGHQMSKINLKQQNAVVRYMDSNNFDYHAYFAALGVNDVNEILLSDLPAALTLRIK